MNDRQLIEDLLSALEYHTEQTRPIQFSKVAIEAAREYLRKPEQPAQQDLPDLIAGALGVSRGTAYDMMREALAEQEEPVDFTSLLREAEEIVQGKPTWNRFIDGTPLSNDIAVWMAVFAQDVARRITKGNT